MNDNDSGCIMVNHDDQWWNMVNDSWLVVLVRVVVIAADGHSWVHMIVAMACYD